jgi:hypothetical protein
MLRSGGSALSRSASKIAAALSDRVGIGFKNPVCRFTVPLPVRGEGRERVAVLFALSTCSHGYIDTLHT